MRWRLSILVLLGAAVLAHSEDPKIVGPTQVDPYKIVKLSVTGLDPKAGCLWKVRPADPKSTPDYGYSGKRNKREIEFVAPPGIYAIELTVISPPATPADAFGVDELLYSVTIGPPVIPPVIPPVVPDPKPKPVPDPTVSTDFDPVLVGKFQTALKVDLAATTPMGGVKAQASALADVYLFAAGQLASPDPALQPKTVGDLFVTVATLSTTKGVPRLPYLTNVRDVAGDTLGRYDSALALDSAKRSDFAAKFKACGLALKEASK